MKSNKYWENRSAERMVDYMAQAEKTAAEMTKAYDAAGKYISEETQKIYETFSKNISEAEARRLLKETSGSKSVRNQLIDAVSKVSDKEKRDAMLAEINAPAYQWRLQRLEAVQQQAKEVCGQLYKAEVSADTKCFTNLANEAYMRNIYDVQKGTGLAFNFAQLSNEQVNAILSRNWTGEHYSERVWVNTQDVADTVKQELLSGVLSGKSNNKIAESIQMRFGVGASDARRLIRTESCYVANAAEMDSYSECDIERYRFVATLDNRTSYLCQDEDEKVYNVADAVPGKNMPPLHPYCRSTTVMELSDDVMKSLQRRAKDPTTGEEQKIPANTSYKEWRNGLSKSEAPNGAETLRYQTNEQLQYRKMMLSDETKSVHRNGNDVIVRRLEGTQNNIYVSECSNIKNLKQIDDTITSTIEAMGLNSNDKMPAFYIMSDIEMGSFIPGAYNPVKNELYLSSGLFSKETRNFLQQSCVAPDSEISTIIHELYHWKDASEYVQKYGSIISKEQYEAYITSVNLNAKETLDRIAEKGYNISEISNYARDSYVRGEYGETYTEYRTLKLLKR